MNINPASARNVYKTMERASGAHQAAHPDTAPAARGDNTDQIEISPEGSRQLEIERASQSILSQIHEPASPQRLESLKAAVQEKSYYVPTRTLVDAMMNHWFGK